MIHDLSEGQTQHEKACEAPTPFAEREGNAGLPKHIYVQVAEIERQRDELQHELNDLNAALLEAKRE